MLIGPFSIFISAISDNGILLPVGVGMGNISNNDMLCPYMLSPFNTTSNSLPSTLNFVTLEPDNVLFTAEPTCAVVRPY